MKQAPRKTITVGDIARIAGVRASAVSNWRSRYHDFPVPVEQGATGDLFDEETITGWLEAHGRETRQPSKSVDAVLWGVLNELRGALSLEEALLLVLQVLFV